jgi:hypothetical protein
MIIEKGKPLQLPNGATILPSEEGGSKVVKVEEVTIATKAKEIVDAMMQSKDITVRRSLADVTVDFNQFNVVMLVTSYTMWGLDSFAIGKLLNLSESVVERVRDSETATEVHEQLIEAHKHAMAATVHGYITSESITAAATVVAAMSHKKTDIALSAAKDVLDRGGFRPVDRVEHSHSFEDELRIRYVQDTAIPTLDLEAIHGNGS